MLFSATIGRGAVSKTEVGKPSVKKIYRHAVITDWKPI